MPYIAINTSLKLSAEQKEKIKAEFGRLIAIIPTKTEANTLVDFSDSRTFYKGGTEVAGAFIEVRLFRKADFEPKKKLTEEIFLMLARELGLANENMYLNIMEFENWGSAGTFKT